MAKSRISDCTTDAPVLQQMKNHYVFSYGTLKHGFPRYNRLVAAEKDMKLLGSGVTRDKNFCMYNLRENYGVSFPLVFEDMCPEPSSTPLTKVVGDLLLVSTEMMYGLDEIERNGFFYKRVLRPVSIMAKVKQENGQMAWTSKDVKAWIYLAVPGTWYNKTPMRRIQPGNHGVVKYTIEQCYDFDNALKQDPVVKFL